jgi:hypothetical protein
MRNIKYIAAALIVVGLLLIGSIEPSSINQTDIVASSTVLNQSTSQSTVTLATAPPPGIYELYYYADLNTPCTTGANDVTFAFNSTDASLTRTLTTGAFEMTASNTATQFLSGVLPLYIASGNVTYSSTVAGTCTTGTSSYDIHVWLKVN